ncbi:HmuY family protein [bacterium SCSIO 12643]|nr:HmuY family protein [bacterium SCSIO 12643]
MRGLLTYGLILLMGLSSCFREDSPMAPITPGSIETVQIEIGYPYLNQIYYDCGTNKIVRTHTKYAWDLAFECASDGYRVRLNTAKGEFIANMGNVSFDAIHDVQDAKWLWDAPSGNLDSTAIGDWRNKTDVYILDLQYDAQGKHLGFKKIQFVSVDATRYILKFSDVDGAHGQTYTILKDPDLNYVHFTFQGGGQTLQLEPEKHSWDLLFTNHYHKFSNLPLPFVLTQVLINQDQNVVVGEDHMNRFSEIVLSDTGSYVYSNDWDVIGYDWKIRNSQDNSFVIDPSKSFVLKTTEGIFYKLRFTDFYDKSGNKGYPTFEVQKL